MSKKRIALLLCLVTLGSTLVIVGVHLLTMPTQPTSPISDAEVLEIGRRYVEEKYGSNYGVNGVARSTFSNGSGIWNDPTASFRVPADWQQPGIIVYVMVNQQTGKIVTVFTSYSKNMPAETPTG